MFNQFKKTALVAAAGLAFVANPAFAQSVNPATAEGEARVRILQPLVIDATDVLDFGVLVKDGAVSGSNYNFSVNNAGVLTCSASWACSGATSAAAFTVTGATGESVQLSIVDPTIDLDDGGQVIFPRATLTLSDTTLLLSGGDDPFTVSGTLTVDGAIGSGTFTGTFDVSAEYL